MYIDTKQMKTTVYRKVTLLFVIGNREKPGTRTTRLVRPYVEKHLYTQITTTYIRAHL